MSATQTNIEFKIIETSDADNVAFERGQYIIEDGSKAYYDPTTGESVSDRIEIGSSDIDDLKRKLSTVYKPKGSWAGIDGIMPTNNEVGDVWNLSNTLDAEEMRFQFTSNDTITVATSDMGYSCEAGQPGHYTHKLSMLFGYGAYPTIPDTNYEMVMGGLGGVSITMDDISIDYTMYEMYSITGQPDGYEITFTEYSSSPTSEFETIASVDRTVTQMTVPYTNKNPIPAGSNIVWIEPGYWDILSPFIDLSGYVLKNTVGVTADKSYAGNYIKHATDIQIDNKAANNLVTAGEVDGVLLTEITRINNLLGGVFHYKGTCAAYNLPTSNNVVGDVWNISEDSFGGANVNITSSSFVIPYEDVGYDIELQDGVYHHAFWFNLDFSDIDYIGDKPGWYLDHFFGKEEIRVKVHNYEPLKYEEEPGGSVKPVVDVGIAIEEYPSKLTLTFSVESDSSTYRNWQEMYDSGTVAGLPIDFVITHYHSRAFEVGDNVVWAEPGYWDTLSNSVDLSSYVTKTSYANASTGGAVKVEGNTHGLNMDSGTLKISPATSVEIAAKTHGYKPITPSQIENAVAAGTHQNMSNSYNAGNKGNLPASYTAVKNYVDFTISSKLTGVYKIMGSIDAEDFMTDIPIDLDPPSQGEVYNIKSGTLNGYYVNNYTVAEEEPMESSTISTTSTTFQFKNPVGLLTLIPFLEHSVSVDLYADGYVSSETWDNSKVITAEFDSYFYDEEEDVLSITFVNLSKTFLPASIEPDVYIVSICDINFDLSLRAGDNVVWTPYGWDKLASDIDLTGYATTSYVDSLIGSLEDAIDEILTEGV